MNQPSQHTLYARECLHFTVLGAAMLGRSIGPDELVRFRKNAYARSFGKHVSPEKRQEKNDKNREPARLRSQARRGLPGSETRKYHMLRHRLRRYELSEQGYYKLLEQQGRVCAICLRPELRLYRGKPKELSIDHCHKTGTVRGLLCSECNRGIAHFADEPDRLLAASIYLERYTPPET